MCLIAMYVKSEQAQARLRVPCYVLEPNMWALWRLMEGFCHHWRYDSI